MGLYALTHFAAAAVHWLPSVSPQGVLLATGGFSHRPFDGLHAGSLVQSFVSG
jgi:hypothetical protein